MILGSVCPRPDLKRFADFFSPQDFQADHYRSLDWKKELSLRVNQVALNFHRNRREKGLKADTSKADIAYI